MNWLRDSSLHTARARAIKEPAMSRWHYDSKTWTQKAWGKWMSWTVRSRLKPIRKWVKTLSY